MFTLYLQIAMYEAFLCFCYRSCETFTIHYLFASLKEKYYFYNIIFTTNSKRKVVNDYY